MGSSIKMSQEFKYIVRVAGRDLDGTKKVIPAIAEIKGVGDSYANAMVTSLKLDSRSRLGQLSDRQLQQLEQALKDPGMMNLAPWLLNRRKDIDSGSNIHRFGSDLDFMIKGDLDREKNILSWRGVRHSLGLKVRGQRTRTTGRKGRTVGVKKSSLQAAQQAQQAAANAEKK
jgi:small subunit ribosomal protein S13